MIRPQPQSTKMRVLRACRVYKSVLCNVIICTLTLLLVYHMQQPQRTSPTVDLLKEKALSVPNNLQTTTVSNTKLEGSEVKKKAKQLTQEVIQVLRSSNDQDRIEMLYEMARALMDTTLDPLEPVFGLKDNMYHLEVLRTRTFPNTARPDSCNGCMAYNFKNMINPTHICQGQEDILLFIMITTIPKEVKDREVVRKTWASLTANNTAGVRHLFLFGGGFSAEDQAIINKESRKYADILQEDFLDNYYNLSYKTIMGYRWVTSHCPGAKYIMRTACDNFIHIPKVLQLLQKQNQTIEGHRMDYAQIGWAMRGLRILRYPTRKWYISANELSTSWKVYPEYCIGTTFVFHRNAAIKFLKASANVPFFVIEDAYYGLVMKTLAMPVAHVPGFIIEAADIDLPKQRRCPSKDKWYSVHRATPSIIKQLWKSCEVHWTLPKHLV